MNYLLVRFVIYIRPFKIDVILLMSLLHIALIHFAAEKSRFVLFRNFIILVNYFTKLTHNSG